MGMSNGMEALAGLLDGGRLVTDEAERDYFGQDYFNHGPMPEAVLQPASVDELARVVKAATAQGLAIYPRGGGWSYTDGYLVTKPGISIDMRAMCRVLEINAEDMFVRVEAGCTWAELDAALKPLGLRTPFWGPMSGRNATVGGGASQGAISFGSAKYGPSFDSIIGLVVVTADGRVVRTGSAAQGHHSAFFKGHGPEMTGMFCGDCGALGVKAEVVLRLMKRPKIAEGMSFGFASEADYFAAAAAVARTGLVTESIGTVAETVSERAASLGVLDGVKALVQVVKTAPGLGTGLKRAAGMALGGQRFADKFVMLLHVVVEGDTPAVIRAQADAVRAAVEEATADRGRETSNAVPTMLRADPFPAYDMLSFTGQRQLPPSTILPFSKVMAFHKDLTARMAARAEEMKRLGMIVLPVYATVGNYGFLYEIVMCWDDTIGEFHRRHTKAELVAKVEGRTDAPEARALAAALRGDLIEVAHVHGGVHVQIGKVYPYLRDRDEVATGLLRAWKRELDPAGLCNPGALGL